MHNIITLEQLAAHINAHKGKLDAAIYDIIDANGWSRSTGSIFDICVDQGGNRIEINVTGHRIVRVIYAGADLSVDGKIRAIVAANRMEDTIRSREIAQDLLRDGTEVYQAKELRRDEEDWAYDVTGLIWMDGDEYDEVAAAFHEMITGGELMSNWGRATVDGVDYLIHYA